MVQIRNAFIVCGSHHVFVVILIIGIIESCIYFKFILVDPANFSLNYLPRVRCRNVFNFDIISNARLIFNHELIHSFKGHL